MSYRIMKKKDKGTGCSKGLYDLLFIFSYSLFIISMSLSSLGILAQIAKITSILSIIFAFFAIFVMLSRAKKTKLCAAIFFSIVSVLYVILLPSNSALIYLIIFSYAAQKIQCTKVVKLDLILKLLMIIFVFIGTKTGVIQQSEALGIDGQGRIRNALGFQHPNYVGSLLYSDILYIKKIGKIKSLALGIIFFVFVNNIIDARTAAIGILITTILNYLPIERILKTKRRASIVASIVMILPIVASLMLVFLPMTATMKNIDTLTSGRVHLFKAYYDMYGVRLFGNNIESVYTYDTALDNSYLYLLLHDGILVATCILLIYHYRLKRKIMAGEKVAYISLMTHAIMGVTARSLTSIMKNQFIFLPEENEKKERA